MMHARDAHDKEQHDVVQRELVACRVARKGDALGKVRHGIAEDAHEVLPLHVEPQAQYSSKGTAKCIMKMRAESLWPTVKHTTTLP
eukprot:12133079-Alexandrium_andersonii.AAC.1